MESLTSTFSTIPETKEWIRHAKLFFAVMLPNQDLHEAPKFIGLMGLNRYNRLTYMFHPDFWGQGYCTEALRVFQTDVFERIPEKVVLVAGVHDGNERSLRVLRKCGFVQIERDIIDSSLGRSLLKDEEDELKRSVMQKKKLQSDSAEMKQLAQGTVEEQEPTAATDPNHHPFTWFCYAKP